jgi:hypothetical protein
MADADLVKAALLNDGQLLTRDSKILTEYDDKMPAL